jgi:YVTN family beta-propeller protein
VAITPEGSTRAYVANNGSNTVSVINTASNTILAVSLIGVSFTDTLPSGLSASGTASNSCGGTVTVSAGSVALSGGSITGGASCTITGITVTGIAAGMQSNSVKVSSANGGTNATPGTASVTVNQAMPTIATTRQPASAPVGTSIADMATVSGYNPTGTVTFNLYSSATTQNSSTRLFTDTETLSGGTATSAGYTTAAAGTDYWVATYNGDSNNSAVTSDAALEPVTVSKTSPAISTSQQPASATVGNSIADKATVSGLYSPSSSDTVTFNLYSSATTQNSSTLLFSSTETVSISGSTATATSAGYTTAAAGTDYWVATYNGDSNNSAVTSGAALEPVTVSKASPVISTSQQPASATVGTSIFDVASVSGGFSPTGTVTFNLYSSATLQNPSTLLFSNTQTLSGGTAASAGYTTAAAGTDYWVATYNGDSNNSAALEPVTVTIPPPSLNCISTYSSEVGVPFNSPAIAVTGGTQPYTFSVATGSLPAGLTLNTSTGAITGTPTATGAFTIQATDSTGLVIANTCSFQINLTVISSASYLENYAANLNIGESYIGITNTGANGASLYGPGLGAQSGNICVNVYAFDPNEELVSCCSCLVTPDQTVNLGVSKDLAGKTLTGVVPTSVTVTLLSTLAGGDGTGNSCNYSAALATTAALNGGLAAWGTTIHAAPGAGIYSTTETPFTMSTLSQGELASIGGRCAAIIGNASGFGICNSCRAGAL